MRVGEEGFDILIIIKTRATEYISTEITYQVLLWDLSMSPSKNLIIKVSKRSSPWALISLRITWMRRTIRSVVETRLGSCWLVWKRSRVINQQDVWSMLKVPNVELWKIVVWAMRVFIYKLFLNNEWHEKKKNAFKWHKYFVIWSILIKSCINWLMKHN